MPLFEETGATLAAWKLWGARDGARTIGFTVGKERIRELVEGPATLRVIATGAGAWLRAAPSATAELELPVRLTPPTLEVLSTQTYVAQGGCEAVVYRVGASAQRDGVRAGERFFPGWPLPGGAANERFALFAVPYDLADVAQRRAGGGRRRRQRARGALRRPVLPEAAARGRHPADRGLPRQGRRRDPRRDTRLSRTPATCSTTTSRSTATCARANARELDALAAQTRARIPLERALPGAARRPGDVLVRRSPHLLLRRPRGRPPGPPRIRPRLGRARRRAGRQRRGGRARPLLRHLRQHGGGRSRLRPDEPLRPPVVDRASRRATASSGARRSARAARPGSPAATTCTSPSCSRGCRCVRPSGGTRTGSRTA